MTRSSDEIAIVIERFDRVETVDGWLRVHQEDFRQALGVHPAKKYESQGGPEIGQIGEFYSGSAHQNQPRMSIRFSMHFQLAHRWHRRTCQKLCASSERPGRHSSRAVLRSRQCFALSQYRSQKAKLAMKIGGEYRIANITLRNWRKLVAEIRVDENHLVAHIKTMVTEFPDTVSQVEKQIRNEGLAHNLLLRLVQALVAIASIRLSYSGYNICVSYNREILHWWHFHVWSSRVD